MLGGTTYDRWVWYRPHPDARSAAEEEFEDLPTDAQARLWARMVKFKEGRPSPRDVDSLGDGILEIRVRVGSDRYRLLFFCHGRTCVALTAFHKKHAMSDDLERYFASKMEDPEFRDSYEDAEQIDSLIDALIELRQHIGLTQVEVARRMGVKQPTVSGFENQDSDPRVSTLQRYARALGARIALNLEVKDHHGWTHSLSRGVWRTNEQAIRRDVEWEKDGAVVVHVDFGRPATWHDERDKHSIAA
jgi:transcriptional regulator with XRE-family HTH domain/putative component of toxin-antitoxin plasmid stabilization module